MDAVGALLTALVGVLLLATVGVVLGAVWGHLPRRGAGPTVYSPQQWVDCFVFALLANGAAAACGMPLTWKEALSRSLGFVTVCSLLAAARFWWNRRGGGAGTRR